MSVLVAGIAAVDDLLVRLAAGIAAVDDLLVRLAADRLYVPPQHGCTAVQPP